MCSKEFSFYENSFFRNGKNVKKKGRLKMALFTFSGGVHPADGKEFAKNSPITEYLPKGDVVLPLGQHIGAPAQPIVSKETRC